ncbi:MAG: methyltransferase domain-containing protein [Verrucomicrobiota bacterium]
MIRSRFFSPGERVALLLLKTEFRISRYHRNGLRKIRKMSWSRPKKINLGSGSIRKDGYLNIDMFPGGDLTLDIRRRLPFESDCCEQIFSEHCLEHIDYPSTISNLLRECLRILEPNGILRFSVPGTEWPLTDYAKGPDAPYFRACDEHAWHPKNCTTRMEHINYHFRQKNEHRFAYDEETATKLLKTVGFTDIRSVEFDPSIDSKHREIGSLFMVARKPAEQGHSIEPGRD